MVQHSPTLCSSLGKDRENSMYMHAECLFRILIYRAIHESLNDDRIFRSNLRFFLNKNLTEIDIKTIFFSNLVNRLFVNRIKKSRFRLFTVYSEISLKGRGYKLRGVTKV